MKVRMDSSSRDHERQYKISYLDKSVSFNTIPYQIGESSLNYTAFLTDACGHVSGAAGEILSLSISMNLGQICFSGVRQKRKKCVALHPTQPLTSLTDH